MAYETIKYKVAEQVLTITLNRPEKLNAFNATMQKDLIDAFDAADQDDDIRAIIVTGAGRGFCVGADLSSGGDTFDRDAKRGPVKRLADGKVEITSMNHGFAVEREGMPDNVRETHVSLFDGSNCGIELTDRPAFSVQYHPEASPGPQDSHYLFEKFVGAMK
jgi:carbamoylphosphate synthase small subunit